MNKTNKEIVFKMLMKEFNNSVGVCALMGNLKAESNFKSMNLQNSANKRLNMTDEEYTQAVDNGTYTSTQFTNDSAGYGLAQWTSSGRKRLLLSYAKISECSIGNLDMQINYLIWEMKASYKSCYEAVKNATSLRDCSDIILKKFERPKNQTESNCIYRAKLGQAIYDEFANGKEVKKECMLPTLRKGNKSDCVAIVQGLLKTEGYYTGKVDKSFGTLTLTAVENFQKENGLTVDGIIDVNTWYKLGVSE